MSIICTYVEERGDGLPSLGDLLEDGQSQTVYEVVGYLRPGGAFLPGVGGRGHTMGVTISPRADLDYDGGSGSGDGDGAGDGDGSGDDRGYEAHTATIRRDLLWMPLPVEDAGASSGAASVAG